ncbi:hypothetical protein BGZ51_004176 [Haplosporangium sp. Z 767]|nr:hypothetical protein BGZ51_004176 [Haplosporangium sp. Z 767]
MTSSSPSALEINMRRLMTKCSARVNDSDMSLQGLELSKYLMNIKALKSMLLDLETELSRSGRMDLKILKEYATQIEALASAVDGSATSHSSHTKTRQQARMAIPTEILEDTSPNNLEFDLLSRRTSFRNSELAHDLPKARPKKRHRTGSVELTKLWRLVSRTSGKKACLIETSKAISPGSNINSNNISNSISSSNQLHDQSSRITGSQDTSSRNQTAQIEAALQNDRAQREEMEAGLSMLMQQLRHNAMAIQQTLTDEQNSGLLDDADQALDNNITRLGKERARLELYSKQSRKTKWMIWGIVLAVSVTFVFMFFIIRIF